MKRRDRHQWMLSRINDEYFVKAKKEGYRARSAYKLIEIDAKFKIIPKTGYILDLGCAPGSWLQVFQQKSKAKLFGIDLLEIAPISNVNFFQGDIFSKEVEEYLENKQFNLIVSDMAPNCSGIKEHDHLKIIDMAEHVCDFYLKYLKLNSNFCIKIFDGRDVQAFIKKMKTYFKIVRFFKPKSSSKESNEFYLVCQSFII